MEKSSITISPANDLMRTKLVGLQLVNEFSILGFGNRSAFSAIVAHYFPKYREDKEKEKLSNWWYGRLINEEMNLEIAKVAEKLRHE